MIEKAKINAPKAKFKVMNFLDLDFEDGSFGAVWFNAGLIAVPKKYASRVLENVYRVLIKDGIFLISVKEGKGKGLKLDKRYNIKKYNAYYTEEELKKLLIKANFKIIKTIKPKLESDYQTHQWIDIFCKK